MTVSEFSLLVIAMAAVTGCVVAIVVARRLLPVLRRSDLVLRRSRQTLRRIQRVTRELEFIARDARQLEGRVSRSAHAALDQIDPILGALRGVVAGTRTGLGALFSSSNGTKPGGRRGRHRIETEGSRT